MSFPWPVRVHAGSYCPECLWRRAGVHRSAVRKPRALHERLGVHTCTGRPPPVLSAVCPRASTPTPREPPAMGGEARAGGGVSTGRRVLLVVVGEVTLSFSVSLPPTSPLDV